MREKDILILGGTHVTGQKRSQGCMYKLDTNGLSVKQRPGIDALEPSV